MKLSGRGGAGWREGAAAGDCVAGGLISPLHGQLCGGALERGAGSTRGEQGGGRGTAGGGEEVFKGGFRGEEVCGGLRNASRGHAHGMRICAPGSEARPA